SLNVVTGANASGKSNLYRSLRLLAETAQGGVINALAKEGGLESTFWAGPENLSRRMKQGSVPVQGGPKQARTRLRLGFCTDEFGYSISLGLPTPSASAFALDPEVKRECIWAGNAFRPASQLVDRTGGVIKVRDERQWEVVSQHANSFDSLFGQIADPVRTPEVVALRDNIRGWRFYDHFRTDADAPARQPQLGTRTPVLHHDGRDLAAALQTIREIGDAQALDEAIVDAFPGSELTIRIREDGRFSIALSQYGLLRPLSGFELSDGTLRYLLWVAALLTPRPPPLMVLNEPETSLHPDLLPALARLIIKASEQTQVWVVSHASRLIAALEKADNCHSLGLEKELGQTIVRDQGLLDEPMWRWPDLKK
ncbi:MAG: AAA family ATPase, partial [Candidatus Thiodiazotropha sp. (ex Codakia orbicularis)]|nr:AAA family ATPase [Candidatus Thiodiazotropha sp. (ex Codakia orbicularis)]